MTPETTLLRLALPLPDPLPDWPEIDVRSSLRRAAKLVGDSCSGGAVLTENAAPIGIVAAHSLLSALSLDEDPVTALPRSGALRDWIAERLSEGTETAVVFLDLDAFGEINKAYGHTEGDAALRRAADAIRETCGSLDFPSRFGGDEFAIGTTRSRAAAEELAQTICGAIAAKGLSASVGVSGGRRTAAREGENVGATVEELLRLASEACLSSKKS